MKKMHVADLTVDIDFSGEILKRQTKDYLIKDDKKADFTISLTKEYIDKKMKEAPHLNFNEIEYIWTGASFYGQLLKHSGFVLHASAVSYLDKAYLFSASSGTGKSTHTGLWQKYFGEDKALIINDDKPAVRLMNDIFYAYGTPWSGKTDKNLNMKVPLQGICFLERSSENYINRIDDKEALFLLLNQTVRPKNEIAMTYAFDILGKLLEKIPVYKMGCNISFDAVELAFNTMKNGI